MPTFSFVDGQTYEVHGVGGGECAEIEFIGFLAYKFQQQLDEDLAIPEYEMVFSQILEFPKKSEAYRTVSLTFKLNGITDPLNPTPVISSCAYGDNLMSVP